MKCKVPSLRNTLLIPAVIIWIPCCYQSNRLDTNSSEDETGTESDPDACLRGFAGDGVQCVDINECKEGIDDCDPVHGTCRNTEGGYACICEGGWELSSDNRTCLPRPIDAQISAGGAYTCLLKTDAATVCWGDNSKGQTTPPPGTFRQISTGDEHACGVHTDGTLACWGNNSEGESTPPTGTFRQVSAGENHSCAIRTDNTVICWGNNDDGKAVSPSGKFRQISAGDFASCGIRMDATAACWGDSLTFEDFPLGDTFVHVSTGRSSVIGVRTDGSLVSGGSVWNNDEMTARGFRKVSSGDIIDCGIRTDNTVDCWGYGAYDKTWFLPPSGTFQDVAAGLQHACGIRTDGTISCWGADTAGDTLPPATL